MILSILSINVKANTCNPDKLSIESISTLEKSDNTEEIEETSLEDKNIKLNLSMSDVGDNIKYKLIIKNDSNEDYKLDEKSLNIESGYMNYIFETEDEDNIIKANSSKVVYLKAGIIDTKVISSHGSNDSENFNTNDKIYLLSTHEVWEDVDEISNSGIDYKDTAYNNTRQLDYYRNKGVTTDSYSEVAKQNNSWWLRSAESYYKYYFFHVSRNGSWIYTDSNFVCGVSPAFRIG